jgi:hypothetical protein
MNRFVWYIRDDWNLPTNVRYQPKSATQRAWLYAGKQTLGA